MTEARSGGGRPSVRLLVAALLGQFVLFGGLILVAINGFPTFGPEHTPPSPAPQTEQQRPAIPVPSAKCKRPRPRADRRDARRPCPPKRRPR